MLSIFTDTLMTLSSMFTVDLRKLPQLATTPKLERCITDIDNVDYCNAILATAPKTTTDRLQRVLNAAARVVSDTKKFDQGLSRLMHQELHWLDIHERVNYKLGVLTHGPPVSARQGASVGLAVKLLHSSQSSSIAVASTLRCTSSTDRTSTSSQHLRSAGICCRWSDNVNTLPDDLRDPAVSTSTFRQSLKTRLFSAYQHV